MIYEWGRFIWWLGHNSSAIQALSSVVTTGVTIILCGITLRYVVLTGALVKAGNDALRMTYVPDLALEFAYDYAHRGILDLTVTNVAQAPVAILKAELSGSVRKLLKDPSLSYGDPVPIITVELLKLRNAVFVPTQAIRLEMAYQPQDCEAATWKDIVSNCVQCFAVTTDCCDITERIYFRVEHTFISHLGKVNVITRSLQADPRHNRHYYLTTP